MLYQQWEEKRKDIESENIQVNWIWECQFKQLQKENADILEYVKSVCFCLISQISSGCNNICVGNEPSSLQARSGG